jgi:general L-amino acid transport system permease protein
MATTDVTQGRARPARPSIDILGWLRENLFSNWYNALISLVLLYLIYQIVSGLAGWLFTAQGWPAVVANLKVISAWTYPAAQLWRVQLCLAIIALLLGLSAGVWRGIVLAIAVGFAAICAALTLPALALQPVPAQVGLRTWQLLLAVVVLVGGGYALGNLGKTRLRWPVAIAWFLLYPLVIVILRGFENNNTMPFVDTNLWGGLMLTLLLSASGIVLSAPLGILLALGRRGNLPVIKWFCVAYIELIRGVPLVTVLYMASLMVPLFLPGGESIDQLVRATIAVTLFSAAYMAENVRGGLQSIPKGQSEAARALGLNVVQTTMLITLPQALRAVIPVLVGQFIGLFKDTSLVTIVGLADLLGAAEGVVGQPEWLGTPGGVWRETFLFIALIYWVISFTMSRSSKKIEENLNVGKQ